MLALGALELRDRLAAGSLRTVELAQSCLARIEAREPSVQSWAWLDRDHVLKQAAALDAHRASGRAIGPLHGLPVGIKDIFDTAAIPTENGTVLDAGRVPIHDSWVVARLKAAGALIMGKTVTAELAYLAPGKTRNPHNPDHTPGGSSSGSAAAVAAGMVPLAVGTQTGGSVIRPAAYCGVVGFKPTFGRIPRTGVLSQSPSLDTVGVFARSVEEAAMLAEQLFGHDEGDPDTALTPFPALLKIALSDPPVKPALVFVRTPGWDQADDDTKAAFAELVEELGDSCDSFDLPAPFAQAFDLRACINYAEMAKTFHHYEARGRDRLSPKIQSALDQGKRTLARDYLTALDWRSVFNSGLDEIFSRYDAILTPAAPGPAPEGLGNTGTSIFNGLWTLCGTPAITVPLLKASNDLPMGVQIVARRGDDARLLRTARWLVGRLSEMQG
ncbi:MAG TPA: amidase [Alphaproteobacteria bacterium]|nr:amidase [Alphaproteobacteria bacterium]